MSRYKAYALAYSSLILGFGSLIMFSIFLYLGSFSLFDLGLRQQEALYIDARLCLLFIAQHSIMIRRGVRKSLAKLIAEEYYSAFYSIASGIVLIVMILFWQKTPGLIASAGGIFHWVLRALFFLSIAGFSWGTRSLGSFDPFGVKTIMKHIHNKKPKPTPLTIRGAYQWVRHPLYLFSIVMIWSCPDLTADRLLFNVLWTTWIIIATMLEERDLVFEFGDQYRQYQAEVPMIIPYKYPRISG
jgi:protein-S-isoprenylcysteine O-methyltransferase Ste14